MRLELLISSMRTERWQPTIVEKIQNSVKWTSTYKVQFSEETPIRYNTTQ